MTTKIKTMVRKVIGSGGSCLITLPKPFCKAHGIKQGDELWLIYNGELLIRPNPLAKNLISQKEQDDH